MLNNPMVMIASDGILNEGKGHPRAAGTFARVLGRYARATRFGRRPLAVGALAKA